MATNHRLIWNDRDAKNVDIQLEIFLASISPCYSLRSDFRFATCYIIFLFSHARSSLFVLDFSIGNEPSRAKSWSLLDLLTLRDSRLNSPLLSRQRNETQPIQQQSSEKRYRNNITQEHRSRNFSPRLVNLSNFTGFRSDLSVTKPCPFFAGGRERAHPIFKRRRRRNDV